MAPVSQSSDYLGTQGSTDKSDQEAKPNTVVTAKRSGSDCFCTLLANAIQPLAGQNGKTPVENQPKTLNFKNILWKDHCRGLFSLSLVA